jgi:N-acetylneuraminic acid mutarotase
MNGVRSLSLAAAAAFVLAAEALADDGAWQAAAPMPLARSELAATVLDGRLYVAGGIAQLGATPAFQVYDPGTDSWRALAPLPEPRHHFGMAALDGRIYVSGGYPTLPFFAGDARSQLWVYDPAGDHWQSAAAMPLRRAAHAMVALDGRLYVAGGVGQAPEKLLRYDPAADRWDVPAAPLPTLREHLAAVALDGKLHVIGGRWRGKGNLATLEIYDPAADAWRRGADMPSPRGGITAAALAGHLHVTGGEDLSSGETFAAQDVYDPATDRWTSAAPLPAARHGLASGVTDNRWYVVGGGEKAGAMTFLTLSDRLDLFVPQGTP